MDAVVFTEEPGMGRALIVSFPDGDDIDERINAYEQRYDVRVMGREALASEALRLRQWVKQAADEYNTAQRRLRNLSQILERLSGGIMPEGVERVSF